MYHRHKYHGEAIHDQILKMYIQTEYGNQYTIVIMDSNQLWLEDLEKKFQPQIISNIFIYNVSKLYTKTFSLLISNDSSSVACLNNENQEYEVDIPWIIDRFSLIFWNTFWEQILFAKIFKELQNNTFERKLGWKTSKRIESE